MRALLLLAALVSVPLPAAAEGRTWVVGRDAATPQEAVAAASAGDRVVLPEGTWAGPLVLDKALTLGSDGGVLDGGGEGTVLKVLAPGAVVDGLRVRGSGQDRAGPDSCVWVGPEAVNAIIRRSELTDCTFGIWIHQGREVHVEDNDIRGHRDIKHPSNRGNGVHLFDSRRLVVRGNRVRDARDGVYVSATHDSLIADNVTEHLRYGIHYMYSFDNRVVGNRTTHCTGGIALMQSHRLVVEDNVSSHNERHGILFRDVQYTRVARNRVEHNAEGLFFFSSLDNEIVDNHVAHNEMGARVWAGTERNVVRGNAFVGNRQQVYYVSSKDQEWGDRQGGNYWSDYLGWDQDGDGRGDRPYRVDSFHSNLMYRFPAAVLLLNSPSLELLSRLQSRLPALRVPTVIDPRPEVHARAPIEERP